MSEAGGGAAGGGGEYAPLAGQDAAPQYGTSADVRIARPGEIPHGGAAKLSRDGSDQVTDEVFNTASHFGAAMLALLGGAELIVKASEQVRAGGLASLRKRKSPAENHGGAARRTCAWVVGRPPPPAAAAPSRHAWRVWLHSRHRDRGRPCARAATPCARAGSAVASCASWGRGTGMAGVTPADARHRTPPAPPRACSHNPGRLWASPSTRCRSSPSSCAPPCTTALRVRPRWSADCASLTIAPYTR
jgi:hypothetical protein